jgi:SAM-dependent methyltransferase/GNAT superfamily N-acetyltransferase
MDLVIDVDDPEAPDVRDLLTTHLAFSRETTPAEYSFALDAAQLLEPGVTFFSARRSGELVGVAALQQLDETHGELKSMHTKEADRRRGIGRALVEHILIFARRRGYRRVSLETGTTDEFLAARALYASMGFEPSEPFANYRPSPYNTFMTLGLDPEAELPPHDFDAMYSGTPPWDIGRPQTALKELAGRHGALVGKVLDVGCGTGEHALMSAATGCPTVGIDASARAIEQARRKAAERQLPVRFVVGDALELPSLAEHFDTVLDCGLFHVFDDAARVRFVSSLSAVVPPGGRYHMLCFSDRQPGDWGPRRVSEGEIRQSFAGGWDVESIEPAVIDITISPDGISAWLASMRRR